MTDQHRIRPTDKKNYRRTQGVIGNLLFQSTLIQPRDEDSVPSLRNLRPMPGAVLSTSGSGSRAARQHTEKVMFFTALILDMQYLCCLFSLSILWLSTSIILWLVVAKSISFLRAGIDILDFFYRGTLFFKGGSRTYKRDTLSKHNATFILSFFLFLERF